MLLQSKNLIAAAFGGDRAKTPSGGKVAVSIPAGRST